MNDKHRKRIWIDSFQTALMIRIAAYLFVYQAAVWAFNAFCDQINNAAASIGAEWTFLASSAVRSVLVLLFVVPLLTLDAIRFAHRLVGPLYRFRKAVRSVAAGEPVALIQLRQGDRLLDFRDEFNLMLHALEEKGAVVIDTPWKAANAETAQTAS
jgi:nitrogen fixation/metabolism regulation signal transduction histidine kinase